MTNTNRTQQRPRSGRGRWGLLLLAASLPVTASAQTLYLQDFEGLTLGPNVDEGVAGSAVWTKTGPDGWVADDSGVPGVGTATDGVTEWAGWSFANKAWWVQTAGDQNRSRFNRASGNVLIADPDEWDDATHAGSGISTEDRTAQGLWFETYLTTAGINVAGVPANSLVLTFDSSWRPEFDSNYHQSGVIDAIWDTGAPQQALLWLSDSGSPNFKPDDDGGYVGDGIYTATNEKVIVPLNNPAGAQSLKLKFGMFDAGNDWWWALDNIRVGQPPLLTGISATGVSFSTELSEALGKSVNLGAGVTVKLDGQQVTVASEAVQTPYYSQELAGIDLQNSVQSTYNQAPQIFTPRKKYEVQVSFTSSDGRQVTENSSFIAPGYTTIAATPSMVTATIQENSYLEVDNAKGVTLKLDGAAVTAASVERVDVTDPNTGEDLPDRIVVKYTAATPFESGSSHTLELTYTTKAGQQLVESVPFTTPAYVTLPSALATAVGTGADAGLKWRTHQLAAGRPAGDTIASAEAQLAGDNGASIHDPAAQVAGGYFEVPYVNFQQDSVDEGRFTASQSIPSQIVGDNYIPGIPGLEGGNDNIAGEGLAYIEIPQAGVYTMGVNSDDGFQVSVGNASNPTYKVLGSFDGGRGASDTVFYFKADAPGVYLFRLLWFEGGGGASVEWFTGNADGERALVNGPTGGSYVTPLKAYRRRTVAEPEIPAGPISIGLNFGTDQPNSSVAAGDLAGVPGVAQKNWNNISGQSGTVSTVVADSGGTAQATTVTVEFTSNNTWASTGVGEENNLLTGADKTLMTGYLDTDAATTSTVKISGLPASFATDGYDVYVYALGGVASGRAGAYRITDNSGTVIRDYVRATSSTNPSSYIQVIPSGDTYAEGNYLVFGGLNAAGLTVVATTADGQGSGSPPRAPINAIQLVSPPTYVAPPTLTVARDGANVVVTWSSGTLESADAVNGPWAPVAGATSPATISAAGAGKFFRAAN